MSGRWMPTWKWWAATITTAGTVVGMVVTGGGIDSDDKRLVLIGLVVQRAVAWVTPNGRVSE